MTLHDPLKRRRATVAVIGAGYVGLTTAACLAHLGHRVRGGRRRRGQGRTHAPRRVADPRGGPAGPHRRGAAQPAVCPLPPTRPRPRPGPTSCSSASRPRRAPTAPPTCASSKQAAGQIAPHLEAGRGRRHQVHRARSARPARWWRPWAGPTPRWCPTRSSSGRATPCTTGCTPTGSSSAATTATRPSKLAALYEPLGAPVLITDPASAETIKYACNAFLAAKVSFVNAIANLCQAVGADSVDVIRGMSYDRRIGADHLAPGPGMGRVLLSQGHQRPDPHRRGPRLRLRPAQGGRRRQRAAVRAGGRPGVPGRRRRMPRTASTVAAWGLDLQGRHRRPAGLAGPGGPAPAAGPGRGPQGASTRPCPTRPTGTWPGSASSCATTPTRPAQGASVLVVLTEWPEFRDLDLAKVAAVMAQPADRRHPQPLTRPTPGRPGASTRAWAGPDAGARRRRRRLHRGHPLRPAARSGRRGGVRRQPGHRARPTTSRPLLDRAGFSFVEADISGRHARRRPASTPSSTWPARRRRPTSSRWPSRSSTSAAGESPTCSSWPAATGPASCRRRPARSTASPSSTPSRRPTGATSTRSAPGRSTTRPSASARR